MLLSARVFNALAATLLSAAVLLAAGMAARTSGATAHPVADPSPTQSAPTTLTWG